ncbi:unnamed protein product (macronuclear) [Paramecium tetraurelia]|uniref:B box-type domain-containing protein n=1 Tax=Paramecium tetraurelia TaxID=5888 RepID=A0BHT9_PARTE|nr:uncharacterized protein GSPATT00029142001 [Paramecium tetraurelia]CAK58106.1 unnamed protein product [Paramecium tetraurelia]|eukprot:XP_001425504.1 hypothetical protein (macronuclear) [Paramecium tetraurelia strain d4-2]
MNQIKELEIKCSIEDHDYAQLVCLNKECKANRVYCDQCIRNGDHIAHINDQWNIQKLILIFQNIEKESETLKSDLCLINQEINKIFTQLNQKITKKYQYSKERLQKLDAKQLHQILNYIIKYEEVEKSVLNEVKKCSDDMIMQIKRYTSELKIEELLIKNSRKIKYNTVILKRY